MSEEFGTIEEKDNEQISSAKIILNFLENDFNNYFDGNLELKNALFTAINCLISKGG